MLPVVPAKAEDSTLQLFLTEAVAADSSAAASSTSSTASTASGEGASTLTALIRFDLTDGKMTFNDTESLDGDTTFRGAARFLPKSQQLSLLLTDTLDASSDESLRSALYLFKTAPEFQQVRPLDNSLIWSLSRSGSLQSLEVAASICPVLVFMMCWNSSHGVWREACKFRHFSYFLSCHAAVSHCCI